MILVNAIRDDKGRFVRGVKFDRPWNKGIKYPSHIRRRMSRAHRGKRLSIAHRKAICRGQGYENINLMKGPSFEVARKICWRKAEGLCANCKIFVPRSKRNIHHVNWNTRDNRQKNLVALCLGCHTYYHRMLSQLGGIADNLSTYPSEMVNIFKLKLLQTVGWKWLNTLRFPRLKSKEVSIV